MASFFTSRRTGALLAGVLPVGGVTLPQHTVGVGTWIGSREEMEDPELQLSLLKVARMRRALRCGQLHEAVDAALSVRGGRQDPATIRSLAIVRLVGLAKGWSPSREVEEQLLGDLNTLGAPLPSRLLERLMSEKSAFEPTMVMQRCLQVDPSPPTRLRLELMLLRSYAYEAHRTKRPEALDRLRVRAAQAAKLEMNPPLSQWRKQLEAADFIKLKRLADALGHNLALVEPHNATLHRALKACFSKMPVERDIQRRLVRSSFRAWTTIRDVSTGVEPPELVSFSAQVSAFLHVFETLLHHALLVPFVKVQGTKDPLFRGAEQRGALLGFTTWQRLLFDPREQLSTAHLSFREWFDRTEPLNGSSETGRLRRDLSELIRVGLPSTCGEEEAARAFAPEMLRTVARVGFGVNDVTKAPAPGRGLVGLLIGGGAR